MIRTFLLRLAAAAVIGLVTALMIARPAPAATLRAVVTVTGPVVTLGDLFEGAGALAGHPVFQAPDLGVDGALPAGDALAAAAAAGLAVDATPLDRVLVSRASQPVEAGEIGALVAEAAANELGIAAESLDVAFDRTPETLHASPRAVEPVAVVRFDVNDRSGRFTADLRIDRGDRAETLTLSGRVDEMVEVPVLRRDLQRREVIGPADVEHRRMVRRQISRAAATDLSAVVGMAARRTLRAGDTIQTLDVEPPLVIERGQLVTLVFERPGLTLTARARALANAAAGDPVTVVNEQSRRTIQGIALASGAVRVEPSAPMVVGSADLTQ